jgi:hypothetical protein
MNEIIFYTGNAWKHHIAKDFEKGLAPIEGGAGKGGTIFFDYDKMVEYLKDDGREWYVAKLELDHDPVKFNFGCDYMGTILINKLSKEGFKPVNMNYR